MESVFKTWKTSRNLCLRFFDAFTIEQLNKVPEGFSNNIIWNLGHIIVSQQSLIYKGSNLDGYVSDELMALYSKGTFPTGKTTENEAKELKELLISLIEKTEKDYNDGKFVSYNERTLKTGFHLGSVRDAFEFNNYHEGIHIGFMMNIRKFV
ncbi:MAG: DinB family protein [Cyclobacteriaceae bacterium]